MERSLQYTGVGSCCAYPVGIAAAQPGRSLCGRLAGSLCTVLYVPDLSQQQHPIRSAQPGERCCLLSSLYSCFHHRPDPHAAQPPGHVCSSCPHRPVCLKIGISYPVYERCRLTSARHSLSECHPAGKRRGGRRKTCPQQVNTFAKHRHCSRRGHRQIK